MKGKINKPIKIEIKRNAKYIYSRGIFDNPLCL
jgi:hypothetical protein